MNSYFNAHAAPLWAVHVLLHLDAPSVPLQILPRLKDHVAHPLPLVHQRRAESFGAGPGLRTSAVEIDARDEGRDEGGCAGEFLGVVGAELDDGGWLDARGVDCKVCVFTLSILVSLFFFFPLSFIHCILNDIMGDETYRCPWQTDFC